MINFLIEKVGFAVCHQITSRCLTFGKINLPICARCSGIYLGFLITAAILFSMYRRKESNLPPLWVKIALVIFIISTIIDGLLSYLNLIPTNNNIRFVTGFLCGSGIMIIIYPVFVFQYYRQASEKKIFASLLKFIVYIVIISAFMGLTLTRFSILGYLYYYLSAFSVVFTFYFINLTMILLVPPFAQKANKLASKYLVLPSVAAIGFMVFELFISYKIHQVAASLVT